MQKRMFIVLGAIVMLALVGCPSSVAPSINTDLGAEGIAPNDTVGDTIPDAATDTVADSGDAGGGSDAAEVFDAGNDAINDGMVADDGFSDIADDNGVVHDTGQDTASDVTQGEDVGPAGPCSQQLNPKCEPVPCDDNNDYTTNDKCVSDPDLGCVCLGEVNHSPCSQQLNPECKPTACDDQDPTTEKDHCVKDPVLGCVCKGQAITDPCSDVMNPK